MPAETPALLVAGYAEAVVGVLEAWRDAGAGRAAGDADVMAPGSASRAAARAFRRAARIFLPVLGIVSRVVPIGAPLVNVLTHFVEAVGIRIRSLDGIGAVNPAQMVIEQRLGWLIAPGISFPFHAAAGRALPFRFAGQTITAAGDAREPAAIRGSIEPRC